MRGIQLAAVWWDDDVVELGVAADNGRFAAQTRVYVPLAFGSDLARTLEGFPRASDDERELLLGTFRDDLAGGGVRFTFRCLDRAGHIGVHLEFRGDPREPVELRGGASFFVSLEAAAVDDFVRQLKSIDVAAGSRHAHLPSR